MPVTIEEVFEIINSYNDKYFPRWRDTHEVYFSNALAGEVGEVCNLVKKRAGGGTNRKNVDMSNDVLLEECVDSFIYLVLLLGSNGASAEDFFDALVKKVEVLRERMRGD